MSTNTLFDLNKLYQTYFNNKSYYVAPKGSEKPLTQDVGYSVQMQNPRKRGEIVKSIHAQPFNKVGAYGQDIWFPITLWINDNEILDIDACTVGAHLSSTVIKTIVSERKGSVHETFSEDDVKFNIKGFLIGKNRTIPEKEIDFLIKFKNYTGAKKLLGGYPSLFADTPNVVCLDLDFPEVQGKAPWIRPFTMQLETDYIIDLIIP